MPLGAIFDGDAIPNVNQLLHKGSPKSIQNKMDAADEEGFDFSYMNLFLI